MTFEKSLINHIAPTLCGIKPGSLFTMRDNVFISSLAMKWQKKVKDYDIELEFFRLSDHSVMFFAYNKAKIAEIINDRKVMAYLKRKNFPADGNIRKSVDELIHRLKYSGGFPHEVGIFLGYPLADVVLFEKNGGKNCKSYSNIDEAKKLCSSFDSCRCMCKKWLEEGLSVSQIVRKYKTATQVA